MRIFYLSILIITALCINELSAQVNQQSKSRIKLSRVKYNGGGDWYNDPSGEVNLLKYVTEKTNILVDPVFEYVDLASDNLFLYPLIFLTGHGNISLSEQEVSRLRAYLENGGFLYVDDDYGLDEFVRKELEKIFPGQKLAELPFNHEIYSSHFKFEYGLPKIHEHDKKPPQGFGLFYNQRLCVFYSYETNISDGWPDPEIHGDTPEIRDLSLKMGTNIIVYALTH